MESQEAVTKDVRVANEMGLHARPAANLAKRAQDFSAEIHLLAKGREANAKSVLDILSLAAPKGAEITLRARGEDADDAVERLAAYFAANLGEER